MTDQLVDVEKRSVEALVDKYLGNNIQFRKKNMVVTGGASGIGEHIARGLKQLGANVIIIDKTNPQTELSEHFYLCDLAENEQIAETLAKLSENYENFGGLINCAAEFPFYLFQDIPMEEWDRIHQVNLRAPVQLIKYILPKFTPGAMIVNFLTIEGGLPFASAYCSSKSGSRALLMSVASELSDEKYIFGFSPGVVYTNLAVEVFSKFAAAGGITLEQFVESSVDNPGYDKMMPVQHCALALIHALLEAKTNHGNVIEPFTYLERLGLTKEEEKKETQASGPLTEYLHELKTMGQFVENIIYERTMSIANERDQLAYLLEEIKQKAEQNEKLNKELIRSSQLAALGEMAGSIAHEINNPLNIIKNSAEFLKIKSKKGDIESNFVLNSAEKVIETSDRISQVISGIQLLSRDGGEDTFSPTSVGEIIRYVSQMASEKLRNNNIEFETTINVDPEFKVNCRVVQIAQVLVNLLNNAADACIEASKPSVHLIVEKVDEQIKFSIKDNGSGIPSEHQEKILNPFFTTKSAGTGTGLGLSISSKILDDHKSKINFHSQQGDTEFSFTLAPLSA